MFNRQSLANIYRLTIKELRSLLSDYILIFISIFVFSVVLIIVNQSLRAEVKNATVAVIDLDKSSLSSKIKESIQLPYFQEPVSVEREKAYQMLDQGKYTFVLEIPPNFQSDLLNLHETKLQLLVDATVLTQSNLGQLYLQKIILNQILDFIKINQPSLDQSNIKIHSLFNTNNETSWYSTLNQIVVNVSMLGTLLVGAAVIREKETGTIEHLLVMPVQAHEVAIAKILSNGLFILVLTIFSLIFMLEGYLKIYNQGSLWLFALTVIMYLFSVTSFGLLLATLTPTLPQFGLIFCPIIVLANLTSGGITPLENMPELMQTIVQFQPTSHFVKAIVNIIFRGATIFDVWLELLIMLIMGSVFFVIALLKFRGMFEQQG